MLIKFTGTSGEPILINVNNIVTVEGRCSRDKTDDRTFITFMNGSQMYLKETFEQFKKAILNGAVCRHHRE